MSELVTSFIIGDPKQRWHSKGVPQLPPLHPCRGWSGHCAVVKHLPLCETVSCYSHEP
jgi:hypothetical protein